VIGADREEELVGRRLVVEVVHVDPHTEGEIAAGVDRGDTGFDRNRFPCIGIPLQKHGERGIIRGIEILIDDIQDP
jgi:hypothetical protein